MYLSTFIFLFAYLHVALIAIYMLFQLHFLLNRQWLSCVSSIICLAWCISKSSIDIIELLTPRVNIAFYDSFFSLHKFKVICRFFKIFLLFCYLIFSKTRQHSQAIYYFIQLHIYFRFIYKSTFSQTSFRKFVI